MSGVELNFSLHRLGKEATPSMAQHLSRPSHHGRHSRLPRPHLSTRQFIADLILVFLLIAEQGHAEIIEIFPPTTETCDEQLETIANTLKPGDELVVHGGTYSQSCRRSITANGTAEKPILIRAATGEEPVITRPSAGSQPQNNVEIINSSYLSIRGLRFRGGDTGVRITSGHHITIEGCEIFATLNNGIAANTGNADSLILRRNHIHHTGLHPRQETEGEGMYLGCHDGACRVTNSLIEGNYIHHLRSTSGGGNDGIEVKFGSSGNIIRNNVIHDTTIGKRYPCIFVYGGGATVNLVEGNSVWNCGEGIYAVSDAIVRNNVIAHSDTGFSSYRHRVVPTMRNLTVVNNTIYGSQECFLLQWDTVSDGVLANNAAYCPGKTAVNATGLSRDGLTIRANYIEGEPIGVTIDDTAFFSGGAATTAFTSPDQLNFWPTATAIFLGQADASVVATTDFNDTPRTEPFDVGAYERETHTPNPGWAIVEGFKSKENSCSP